MGKIILIKSEKKRTVKVAVGNIQNKDTLNEHTKSTSKTFKDE